MGLGIERICKRTWECFGEEEQGRDRKGKGGGGGKARLEWRWDEE